MSDRNRSDAESLVEELVDVIDDIGDWSEQSSDFVEDCENRLHNPAWSPSDKQLAWLARLHVRFVDEEGEGESILARLGV